MTIIQSTEAASQAVDHFPSTDRLDRDIARLLANDARLSFRRLASDLGVAEGTIRGRVKRLQTAGLLKFTPIVDIGREPGSEDLPIGGQHMIFLTITYVRGEAEAVRDSLLAIPQVRGLYDANAALRLVAVCVLPSIDAAAEVCNQVLALQGVRQAESEIILKTIKYNAAIGPIATLDDIASPHNPLG